MDRVYELKIALENTEPAVWRRLLIPETLSFYKLHHAIQIAFDWENSHLYAFHQGKVSIGNAELLQESEVIDDRETFVNQILKGKGDYLCYEYDFGDGWNHIVAVEDIHPDDANITSPVCLDGAMAAPPEDCGGIEGYNRLKRVMANSKHPEYKELNKWLGKHFGPEHFDLKKVNSKLKNLPKYIQDYESGL